MNRLILSLLCAVTLLSACNTGGGTKNKITSLDDAINQYVFALRWGRYKDAHEYHAEADGGKPALPLDKLQQIRVTGHEIYEKNVNEEITEAIVKGEINYYHTEYGTLRKLPLNQIWWYEPESKRWYLKGEMPKFR